MRIIKKTQDKNEVVLRLLHKTVKFAAVADLFIAEVQMSVIPARVSQTASEEQMLEFYGAESKHFLCVCTFLHTVQCVILPCRCEPQFDRVTE